MGAWEKVCVSELECARDHLEGAILAGTIAGFGDILGEMRNALADIERILRAAQ